PRVELRAPQLNRLGARWSDHCNGRRGPESKSWLPRHGARSDSLERVVIVEGIMSSHSSSRGRVTSTLDALLRVVRSLAGSRQGGMLSEALDLLLEGTGSTRGAVYLASGGVLELVAERGLGDALRALLRRLPRSGAPWFVVQRAAQSKRLVVDRDLEATAG